MAGHARERSPGRWELRVYTGKDALTGGKRYATRTVSASGPREADRKLAAFVAEIDHNERVSPDGTFGDLIEQWYRHRDRDMTPGGRRETRRIIDTNLKPSPLWNTRLATLAGRGGTLVLDDFYAALRQRGGRCRLRHPCPPGPCLHGGGGPLKASTVHRLHSIVHAALEQAVVWEVIRRNPADKADPGTVDDPDLRPPETGALLRLFQLAAERDIELGAFLILAAVTGARRGELLALWWEDVDLDVGLVTFRHVISIGEHGPERIRKGRGRSNRKGGERTVPLHAAAAAILRAQHDRCAERYPLALDAPSYVFPAADQDSPSPARDPLGLEPWRPDSTSRRYRHLRAEAGLGRTRLHDLRRFVVTELLSAGVDLRTVQEVVGHAPGSPTTLKVYAKARDPQKVAAAGVMAKLLELGP